MNADESSLDTDTLADDDKVVMFRPRRPAPQRVEPVDEHEHVRVPLSLDMERFPVDIRGDVTFGRLMSGLSTVGLTVRIDSRTGRVVIMDDSSD